MTSAIESLPAEMLQNISLNLDPQSLVSLKSSSPAIRKTMKNELGSAFWRQVAKDNRIHPYSSILEGINNNSTSTVADRMVTLDERRRSGMGSRIWRCDMMRGDRIPYLVEDEEGRKMTVSQGHESGNEKLDCSPEVLRWSGKYACVSIKEYPHLLVWNTRSNPPTLVNTPLSEYVPTPETLSIWRHYLMYTPLNEKKNSLKKGENLNILTIFNLEGGWEGGREVPINVEEDFELVSEDKVSVLFVIVMETARGEGGRAVVRHRLIPGTIFIVRVTEAAMERKIVLPSKVAIWDFDAYSHFAPLSAVGYRVWGETLPTYLALACPDSTTIVARLLQLDEDSEDMAITPEGNIFVVRAHTELLDGNNGSPLPPQQGLNLVLYSHTAMVGDSCPGFEHERDWKEKTALALCKWSGMREWKIRINEKLKVVAVMFQAIQEGGREAWIQVVNYEEPQQLRPLYRIQLGSVRYPQELAIVGDLYISVLEEEEEEEEEKDFILTTYDVRSEKKVGEKRLGVAFQSDAGLMFNAGCIMEDDGAAVLMSLVSDGSKESSFCLVRYL